MTVVRSEMVANVWKVLVEVGAAVSAGDDVAILESMKMEIPIESPVAGRVVTVHVAPDDVVNEGDPLFDIEPV